MRRKLVFDAVWSSVEILDYNSQCWSRGRALVEAGFSWVLTSFGKFRNGRSLLLPLCPKKEFRFLLDLKKILRLVHVQECMQNCIAYLRIFRFI